MLNCFLPVTALVLTVISLSYADVYLHNPRGSNNRLNGAKANRKNNNRLFDSQNNNKGGYNVGDKNQASNSEGTQFNMHYFQSGKGYASQSGLTGKSLLTIEWTNQHGCNDRDLNCNFVLQYRCQDDTKHQTLNHHTMRNGRQTTTPQYVKTTLNSRLMKNIRLNIDSTIFFRGLHESWEWYDKCAKRPRIGINGDWSIIPGDLKQIDHGLTSAVWGVNSRDAIYRLKNEKSEWQLIPGSLKHVTAGEAGIWGVNKDNQIYYRNGVTETNPSGESWEKIPGALKQIDSGPSGIVYGVNAVDKIYCRTGIASSTPSGTGWRQVTSYGRKKYVSCGVLGCWGVNRFDRIWYRSGVTKTNCVGTGWHYVPGRLKQIEVGLAGDVYGINSAGKVYRRTGITASLPRGSGWKKIKTYGSHITTGLNGQYLLVDGQIQHATGQITYDYNQNLKGDTSIYTRQNPNGVRRGYECPEERDYYPYKFPTDWTDIAVFTDNESMCEYYQKESFNVKPKEECLEYYSTSQKTDGFRHVSVHTNKIDCEKNQGYWVSFSNYLEEYPKYQTQVECESQSSKELPLKWAIPYRSEDIDNLKMVGDNVDSLKRCLVALAPPECKKTPYTRTNHLGNARGVVPVSYNWVIPHFPSSHAQRCVIRLRYNISTDDDSYIKDDAKNVPNFRIKNNPEVEVGDAQLPLKLAINAAQFGRTFQDRSHLFKLIPRPDTVSNSDVIYNLNIRGKRGNIVQAYPAVEYDFVPKRLNIARTTLVHIQWTGSNTNPRGNAGQGTAGTDRNNMVEMKKPSVNYPLTSEMPLTMFTNAEIVWSSDPNTKTKEDLILSMASSGYCNSEAVCQGRKKAAFNNELNNAPASYRGMLLRFAPGSYYYMCTRNNNFSNRNQKGRLVVGNV